MKQTNLNMLFQQLIINFAHLITVKPQTKAEFLETVKSTYCLSNPRTNLFYQSCEKSEFETIRLSNNQENLLFNQ
jgi:hypothetical protein